MKYYLIAGEASGDLHGSNLMRELKKTDAEAEFRFFGGDLMRAEGGTLVKHYKDMAFMGFVTVLRNLKAVLGNIALCRRDIGQYRPDVLILIDYPSFNLRVAKFVKTEISREMPVYFYISPKIWAWKEFRIKQIKKYIDHIFSILPFEIDFYKKHQYEITYVGNPSVDAIENRACRGESFADFAERNHLTHKPIVAILAGSRKQEICNCLPVMMEAAGRFPDHQFVIAGAPGIDKELYDGILGGNANFSVVFGQTYALLQQARAALINSGTASLEAALINTPQVVGYHVFGGKLARFILRKMIKVDFASLVNLVAGREVVKEYLADAMTAENLGNELDRLLHDEVYRQTMLDNYAAVRKTLGGTGASHRTAMEIFNRIEKIK